MTNKAPAPPVETSSPRAPHRVLHYLMAVMGVTDADLATKLGLTRQTIYNRRTGRSAMSADDIFDLAGALDVDAGLFMGPAADAVEWLLAHRREQFVCTKSRVA